MTESFQADVKQIKISEIVVGERRRQKLGDLRGLIRSIGAHGLLHPIIVRNGNELVVGERRLEACKRLGWESIAARRVETMTDEELRAVEFDENAERLALTDFEGSKQRLAQIRQAEVEAKADLLADSANESLKRGGQKKPNSRRAVAEKIGISETSQREIENHVGLAERYPFLQRNDWRMYQVLHAGEELEKLPEPERGVIGSILDQPAIPPEKAIEIIKNMAEMPSNDRKEIYQLAESNDDYDRSMALTKAALLPPPVDPALQRLREASAALEKAVKFCKTELFLKKIEIARDGVKNLTQEFTKYWRKEQ